MFIVDLPMPTSCIECPICNCEFKNDSKSLKCHIFKWNTEDLKDCSHNELEQYCKTLNIERQESRAACSEFNIFLDKLEDALAIDYTDWMLLYNIIHDALKMRARRFPNYERRNHYDKYDLVGSPCKRCKYFRAEDEQCTSGYFPFDCGLNNNKYFEAKED